MSNERTTILAIAIAALMMLCAVSGAVIYCNSNNSSDRDVPVIDPVRPVDPIRPVDPVGPKVNYLPDNLDDLNTMLSGSSYSDSDLLLDSLMYRQYRYDGSAYTIRDTSDLACYLYTLGLNVFGNSLIPDYSTQTIADADVLAMEEDFEFMKEEVRDSFEYDEEEDDVAEEKLVSGFKRTSFTETFDDEMTAPTMEAYVTTVAIEATAVATCYDLDAMTIDQFTNTVWFTDRECIMDAFMFFLNNIADESDTILDAMIGTPFIINDEDIIVVGDVNDLSLFLYSLGIEIVSNNAMDMYNSQLGLSKKKTLTFAIKAEREDVLQVESPKNYQLMSLANRAATAVSFMDLSTSTVTDFCLAKLAMIDSANDSRSKVMYTASFLDMFNSKVMLSDAGVFTYVDEDVIADKNDGAIFGTAFKAEASVDTDNIALSALTGTVFTDADGKIHMVKNATTFSSFLDSLGLVVKNNDLYCYSFHDSALIKMDIKTMDTFTLFYILTENGYSSFATSLEDLEKVAMEYASEEEQKQEESTAAEPTESAAMEEASECVDEAAAAPDVEPCCFYDDGTIADQLVMYLEQFESDGIVMDALIGCYNGDTCMEGEEYVYEFLAFYGFDAAYWANESIDDFLYFVMNEYGGAGYENELDEEGNVVED